MAHHHHHSHVDCIRLVPIFNHLNEEQMSLIAQSAHEVHYAKNALLFGNGDKDDTLYIVNNGRVRIYNLNESGREQTVRILNPGDFMGEVAIFQTESYHSNYAEAISEVSICRIHKKDMDNYLDAYPEIMRRILSDVTKRLQVSEKQTMQVGMEQVESRIINFLAEYVEDEENHTYVTLPMSKKELASYLGTTPETISRKFSSLEDKGLIKQHTHKYIEIFDLDELLFASS